MTEPARYFVRHPDAVIDLDREYAEIAGLVIGDDRRPRVGGVAFGEDPAGTLHETLEAAAAQCRDEFAAGGQ